MCRFYATGPSEILNLDNDLFNQLLIAIPSLEAHEQLMALKVSDYQHMNDSARRKLFKALNKLANPTIIKEEQKALKMEDLNEILNR